VASEEQMIQALRARRGPPKALLVAIPLVVVALAAGGLVLASGGNKSDKSFSALSRCLIGEPLKPGENVFFRVREAELGSKKKAPADNPAGAWPARCAPHATALYRSIDATGKTALLKRLLTEQLGCGDSDSQPCKFPEAGQTLGKADEIWKSADIAGIHATDAPEIAGPDRLKPELGADWPVLGDASFSLADSRVAENGELWLLLNPPRKENKSPRLCRVLEGGAKARCTDAKMPELTGQIRFVDGIEPPAVSGTAVTDEGTEEGAFSLLDGSPVKVRAGLRNGFALEKRGNDFYLLEVAAGLVKDQKKVPVPKDTEATVFGNWLGWFETKDEVRTLVWRKIGAGGTLEGDPVKLEGEPPARVETCSAPGGGGAAYGRSVSPAKQTVWFATESGWSKPVSGPMAEGQRDEWSLVCSKERAARFWVMTGDSAKIGSLDCRPKGCEKREVEWKGVRAKRWLAVTELGGQTAALVETFEDDKRLYIAPFDKIGDTPPIVLMDSPEFSGPKFENTRIVIGPELVLVLFTTDKGLHGLFVNAKARGPVAPA
jgi:hypothetical protein